MNDGNEIIAAAAQRAKVTREINILPPIADLPFAAETANLRYGASLADSLLALLPLVGLWRGEGQLHTSDKEPIGCGHQILATHNGGDYISWEAITWKLPSTNSPNSTEILSKESGYWKINLEDAKSEHLEVCLANTQGRVEIFYGHSETKTSWSLIAGGILGTPPAKIVKSIKRIYGILPEGDLGCVIEQTDDLKTWTPILSAQLTRLIG